MEDIKKRIELLATTCDKDTITLLNTTLDTLHQMYNEMNESMKVKDITAFNKKKSSIIKFIERLEQDQESFYFKTITDVHKHIISLGYNVAERTLYEHKKQGKLVGRVVNGNNIYYRDDVESYAFKYLKKLEDDSYSLSYADKKARAEAEYKEIKTERERLLINEAYGRLIDRDVVAREFAGRIELIKRYMDELINSVPALLVGCDEKLIRDILKEKLNYMLEQYSDELELLK